MKNLILFTAFTFLLACNKKDTSPDYASQFVGTFKNESLINSNGQIEFSSNVITIEKLSNSKLSILNTSTYLITDISGKILNNGTSTIKYKNILAEKNEFLINEQIEVNGTKYNATGKGILTDRKLYFTVNDKMTIFE